MTSHPDTLPERWEPWPGYEGYYEVSSRGRVRAVRRAVHSRVTAGDRCIQHPRVRVYPEKILHVHPVDGWVELHRDGVSHRLGVRKVVGRVFGLDVRVTRGTAEPGTGDGNPLVSG